MKKKIIVAALMSLMLFATSCGSIDNTLESDSDENTEESKKDEDDKETDETDEEDDKNKDSTKDSQKPLTIVNHLVTAAFEENESLTSAGTYPEIIVNEDFMMDYPKFWAAMTNYSDSIAESSKDDISYFGYGTPREDNDSYQYDVGVEVLRFDDKIFALKVSENYYWSYSEEETKYSYLVTYDINTGKRIWSDAYISNKEGLGQILYDAVVATYPREKDLVNETVEDGSPMALYYINDMVEYDYLPCYIQGDQFIVHFNSYSIMYNDNEYEITIPVDDLQDYLNQDYLPDTTGNLEDVIEFIDSNDDVLEGHLYTYDDGGNNYEEQEEIHVSTPEEFVDAIAPNTRIIMEPGKYDISDYVLEPTSDFLEGHPYWGYSNWMDEYGPSGVYNMTIEGSDHDDRPEIVINSAYDDVLSIINSNNITLNNLIIGHDVEKGTCSANVLALYSSNGISCDNLDLYGCGAYGLFCKESYNVYMYDSCIHDCTYGIIEVMGDSTELYFYDCEFIDNEEYTLIENAYNSGYLYFTGCKFDDNKGDLFSIYSEPDQITFTDCEFGDEESEFLNEHFDMILYYEDGGAG